MYVMLCNVMYVMYETSTRHRKNSKQSGIVALDNCFALFGARQYGVTTRDQALIENYPRTLILALTQNS